MANIVGTKWGDSQLGTPGGTVTWSIAGAGLDITRFGTTTTTSVSGSSFLSYDFAAVIAAAFAEWSTYGDIEFQQVPDGGGAAGVGADADIRIFFGEIPGGTAGYAFYPSSWGSPIGGDILLDTLPLFESSPDIFQSLVLHEIGHALGLGHVDSNSIMTPTVTDSSLQADDIAGIQAIYGVQDNPPGEEPAPPPPPPPPPPEEEEHDHDHDPGPPPEDNQWLSGTEGADTLRGGVGDDTLVGNGGSDRLYGGYDQDVLHGGDGNDMLYGGADQDLLTGGSGRDLLLGHSGNDTMMGGNTRDTLKGGNGDDMLYGDNGFDRLIGGKGNDTLEGGNYIDVLSGGEGNDIFVFNDDHGRDRITDFNALGFDDKIDFSGHSTINSLADVANAAEQFFMHVRIHTGDDDYIQLNFTNLGQLDGSDFLF